MLTASYDSNTLSSSMPLKRAPPRILFFNKHIMSFSQCPNQRPCVGWVETYFKDCLCNVKDDVSFGFGVMSFVCWGVAEIPQIVTNFRTKSGHGLSLTFLLTWVIGDIFNLVGCLLEPVTLPTQYYTALLYTISTVVLVIQCIYYDHFYKLWKCRTIKVNVEDEGGNKPLKHGSTYSTIPVPSASPKATAIPDFHYTSARSLASSGSPHSRTFMRAAKSGPSAMGLHYDSSSDEDCASLPSQPRPIPRSVGYGTFLATSLTMPLHCKAFSNLYPGFTATNLHQLGSEHSVYGQWLGWLMAAIYMGGRLPQIWLNIKRGSVEGLNPLMFIFALVANVTYVLSIVVRTTEWEKLKANMPWLLDAAVCVALDSFIIVQYIYYRYLRKEKKATHNGDYMEPTKHFVP